MERPDSLPQVTEGLGEKVERPLLSPRQVKVLESGAVNGYDEVLAVLEESEQIIPDYRDRPII